MYIPCKYQNNVKMTEVCGIILDNLETISAGFVSQGPCKELLNHMTRIAAAAIRFIIGHPLFRIFN